MRKVDWLYVEQHELAQSIFHNWFLLVTLFFSLIWSLKLLTVSSLLENISNFMYEVSEANHLAYSYCHLNPWVPLLLLIYLWRLYLWLKPFLHHNCSVIFLKERYLNCGCPVRHMFHNLTCLCTLKFNWYNTHIDGICNSVYWVTFNTTTFGVWFHFDFEEFIRFCLIMSVTMRCLLFSISHPTSSYSPLYFFLMFSGSFFLCFCLCISLHIGKVPSPCIISSDSPLVNFDKASAFATMLFNSFLPPFQFFSR